MCREGESGLGNDVLLDFWQNSMCTYAHEVYVSLLPPVFQTSFIPASFQKRKYTKRRSYLSIAQPHRSPDNDIKYHGRAAAMQKLIGRSGIPTR